MNTQYQIPSNIAAIIEQKQLARKAKYEADEKRKLEERNTQLETGRDMLQLAIAATLLYVPRWLHPYDVTEKTFDDDDLCQIGRSGEFGLNKLQFLIPGLAPIEYRFEEIKGTSNLSHQWRSAQSYNQWREYGPAVPRLDFTNSSYWREDLESILVEAREEMVNFEVATDTFKKEHEADVLRAERNQKLEEEAEARRTAQLREEEAEELQLFNTFKDDPVAISLLRAFQMINQERTGFASQIEDANSSLYHTEEFWSRKAADLRRQADDAQRRAEDEKYRLQSDLDDAEAKLKKAQRGW